MPRFPLLLVLILAACAAPAPVLEAPPPPAPEARVPFEAALVDSGEAILPDGARAQVGRVLEVFPGAAGGAVLFTSSRSDSTLLFRLDDTGIRRIHGVNGTAVYTVAWSADGMEAAFGHYRPLGNASPGRPAMGAGDILIHSGTEPVRVGCSASRAVLGWAPDGNLLVRNTDNLYLVSRDGCATAATVDARRMHGLTVSPDASHLAFVHRELEYNRATRAYEADSTFRLTDLDGGNPKTIVSFRYRPKRLSWKADGSELAFDVQATQDAGRAISIFDVASGVTAFLHPPATDWDEFAPVWAPDGGRIAYLRGDEAAGYSVWIRSFSSTFPESLPESENADIVGWVDGDALIYRTPDGTIRVFDVPSRNVTQLADANAVLRVRRAEG